GLGIIEWSFLKGRMLAAFNADDFGDAIGGKEFELISGQRRAFGIQVDVHRAEATAAFLNGRLLREQARRQPEKNDGQKPFHDRPPFCSLTASLAIAVTSRSSI